jgi:hypothetical protein
MNRQRSTMNIVRLGTALLIGLAGPVYAAEMAAQCHAPTRPIIPDGGSAKEQDLLSARTALETYLTEGDRYLVCLRKFEEDLGEEIAEIDGHELLVKYNAMVDEMYLAGDEFNIALRKFKSQ